MTPCFHVQEGDRLGVFHEGDVSPVSYGFDALQASALMYQLDEGEEIQVKDTIKFDTLVFPYDISIQAYIYTGEFYKIIQK